MKIALIELGNSHDECLYSQIRILKAKPGVELHLICSRAIFKRTQHFNEVDTFHQVSIPKGFFAQQKAYRKLKKYILKQAFAKLIFNTAQGSEVKKLMPFLRKYKGKMFGILHDTKKLEHSTGQKIISKKLDGYFVLNHYLEEKLKGNTNKPIQSFYPIFFPSISHTPIAKPSDNLWFVVPGQLETKRRDYEALFEAVKNLKLASNYKFILLGKSMHSHGNGHWAKKFIAKYKLQDNFVLWDNFVPNDVCEAYLQKADYLMPLIHPNHPSAELYKHQITGAFNLAFAYKIPLLLEQQFKANLDFKNNSIFYTLKTIEETIYTSKTKPTKK